MAPATIQWQPQANPLTKPLSYSIQIVPRSTSGYDKMAADIAALHPNYNAELVRSLAPLIMDWIQNELLNGNAVNLEEAFRFVLTCSGSLASPNDPLPDDPDMLHVRVYPSRSFVQPGIPASARSMASTPRRATDFQSTASPDRNATGTITAWSSAAAAMRPSRWVFP